MTPHRTGRRSRTSRGQGMTEYALTLALIGLAAIVGLGLVKASLTTAFNSVATSLKTPVISGGGGGSGVASPTAITGQGFAAYSTAGYCVNAVTGSDGNIWCLESSSHNRLMSVSPTTRAVTEYPSAASLPLPAGWSGGGYYGIDQGYSSATANDTIWLVGTAQNATTCGSGRSCLVYLSFNVNSHVATPYATTVGAPAYSGSARYYITTDSNKNEWATAFDTGTGVGAYVGFSYAGSVLTSGSSTTNGDNWQYPTGDSAGNVWFVNTGSNYGSCQLTRMLATSPFTQTSVATLPTRGSNPLCYLGGMTFDGAGNLWVDAASGNVFVMDKVTTTGTQTQYPNSSGLFYAGNVPTFPVLGPDGNIWLADGCAVDQVNAGTGVETNIVDAQACALAFATGYQTMVVGPDNALWVFWGGDPALLIPANPPYSFIGRVT